LDLLGGERNFQLRCEVDDLLHRARLLAEHQLVEPCSRVSGEGQTVDPTLILASTGNSA
jgi:hypothetical protein